MSLSITTTPLLPQNGSVLTLASLFCCSLEVPPLLHTMGTREPTVPSFLGVITHILGVENLTFSMGFWGPRVGSYP